MAAPQQQYQARSPHNERGEREDDEPRLFPLTSAQGRAIQRQRSGATLEGDSGESPLSDEETDERRAAEADWERTLERLKSELVPVTHVVAIDGSPDSDRAFSWAVRSLPRHDRLLLVYGTRRVPMPGLEVTLLERRSADDQRRKQRRKVRALAQHYAHRCEAAGRECYFERVEYWGSGDLANHICRTADENGAHTVVAGSRGLGPMQRLMLGSVSTALLHQCHSTVVIARDAPEATREQTRDLDQSHRI